MTTQMKVKPPTVTEAQKRTVGCPKCCANRGKPCRASRIPGPSSFGGGWGGPPDLDRAHPERRTAYLEAKQVHESRLQLARQLQTALLRHADGDDCADTRGMLMDALRAYEACGDHDHGNGPIAAGAACPGGDCLVARAREFLANEATIAALKDGSYEVWADGKLRKVLPTLDQARVYATWIRHHEGLDTAIRGAS